MKADHFCYWLQGFFELSRSAELTPVQVQAIKNHLALVFKHDLDPPDPDGSSQATHDSGFPGQTYRC